MTPTMVKYSVGNPHAPIGNGAITVELAADGAVRLVVEKHPSRREWAGRAEAALWATLSSALAGAGFPAKPSRVTAPPGTASFELQVERADGRIEATSGFPSPEYKDVSVLFMTIVSQMTGKEVLGFELPSETRYVAT